jgi:hypothetical protein
LKTKVISRQNFLKGSISVGAFLTVPSLLESCNTLPNKLGEVSPLNNPNTSVLLKSLYAGTTAPNPHNTQAWKFKIISDLEALLYVDENRILPATDPPARQIHIGQGCFLECFKIGASQFGYNTKIQYFPEGEYSFNDIGKKPVAKMSLELGDNQKKKWFSFLQTRTTNRSIYSGGDITHQEVNKINSQMIDKNLEPKWILTSHPNFSKIQDLLIKAFSIEIFLRRTNEENRIWFRTNDSEIYSKKDGLSLRGNGMDGLSYFLISKFFVSTKPEDWHSEFTSNTAIDSFKKQVESSKAFVYLQTSQNKMKDWVLAGERYAELNLMSNANHFSIHPMSQILQEYPEMENLKLEFEKLLEVPQKSKIQMFGRIGKSDYAFYSPRRDVKDMEMM